MAQQAGSIKKPVSTRRKMLTGRAGSSPSGRQASVQTEKNSLERIYLALVQADLNLPYVIPYSILVSSPVLSTVVLFVAKTPSMKEIYFC